jgi:hypothetical protein
LLIAVATYLYANESPSSLAALNRLAVCHINPILSVLVLFAIIHTFLNRIRWPFLIVAYFLLGVISMAVYARVSESPLMNAAAFGSYALLGAALLSHPHRKFHLIFAPKVSLPAAGWLLGIIVIDTVVNYSLQDRFSSTGFLDWRVSLIALTTGLVGTMTAQSLYKLPALSGMINQLVLRTTAEPVARRTAVRVAPSTATVAAATPTPTPASQPHPSAQPRPVTQPRPVINRPAPTPAPTPVPAVQSAAPQIPTTKPIPNFQTKNKNKLISQTDLPVVNIPSRAGRKPAPMTPPPAPVRPDLPPVPPSPRVASPVPPAPLEVEPEQVPAPAPKPEPQLDADSWLAKHLEMLEKSKKN